MESWDVPVPPGFAETDAGRLDAFLRARGVEIDGVQLAATKEGEVRRIVVIALADPAADVAAYVPTQSVDEQREAALRATLRSALQTIRAKAPSQRTPAESGLDALVRLLRGDRDG